MPDKRAAPAFFTTATAALVLYLTTLPRHLSTAHHAADGGELLTAALTGGIPHPPGYPTYLLLSSAFAALLSGPLPWRFNLFSAVCMATAAGLTAYLTKKHLPHAHPLVAPAVGLTFAAAPPAWSQAIVTEVYALYAAVLAGWLLLITTAPSHPGRTRAFTHGVVGGLCVTAHPTGVLLWPTAVLLLPARRRPFILLGGLAGLLPILVLPLRAAGLSPVVWGDATTLSGLWWLISGVLYRPNLFTADTDLVIDRLTQWWPHLVLITAALPAAGYASARHRKWTIPVAATAVLYTLYALGYRSADAVVNLLPAWVCATAVLGFWFRRAPWTALLLPVGLIAAQWTTMRVHPPTWPTPVQMAAVPADAIVLTDGRDETTFRLWAAAYGLSDRPDLIVVDPHLFAFDWYRQRLGRRYPDLTTLGRDHLPSFLSDNDHRPLCNVENEKRFVCHPLPPTP